MKLLNKTQKYSGVQVIKELELLFLLTCLVSDLNVGVDRKAWNLIVEIIQIGFLYCWTFSRLVVLL